MIVLVCRITDLRFKEVISINNGCCLGPVSDIELDTCTARIVAIVIFGRARCFGIMGREDDIVIPWEHIQCIGEDTVLVKYCPPKKEHCREPRSFFDRLFGC